MGIGMGGLFIGGMVGVICGGFISYQLEKKINPDDWKIVVGGLIGCVAGILIGHAIYSATDEFKELQATRKKRKNEFEGYMHQAGLNQVMIEFCKTTNKNETVVAESKCLVTAE